MLWEREGPPWCWRSVLWEEGDPCCGRKSVLHAVGEGGPSMVWERVGPPCCGRGRVLHAERSLVREGG